MPTPPLGQTFRPGANDNGVSGPTRQRPIQTLSFRVPQAYGGGQGIAPSPLLQAPGGAGQTGANSAVAQAIAMLAGLLGRGGGLGGPAPGQTMMGAGSALGGVSAAMSPGMASPGMAAPSMAPNVGLPRVVPGQTGPRFPGIPGPPPGPPVTDPYLGYRAPSQRPLTRPGTGSRTQ